MSAGGETLLLSAADVRTMLPMHECIEVMASAFRAVAAGCATVPRRTSVPVGARDESMLLMPATLLGAPPGVCADGREAWFGAKVLSIIPTNGAAGRDSHQGVIVLFEGTHGSVAAVIDAATVTAIRTAAVSGLASRLLARPDATRVAIIGSGVQAVSHLAAMAAVRPIRDVRVWSRNPDRCAALVRTAELEYGVEATVGAGARGAVEGADIVCTVTAASTPVLQSTWIGPGTHVNAVGAHRPTERELDSETVRRARVFVDHMPAAMAEAGDVLIPLAESRIDRAHVRGDLTDLVSGRVAGRTADAEVTVFKSVGIAIEDVAAAAHAYRRAVAAGVGTLVRLA